MMAANFPWQEPVLKPDRAIAENWVYRGLRTVHLQQVGDRREYALVCDTDALRFQINLTGILSEDGDRYDLYRPDMALEELRRELDDREKGHRLAQFLRYSPWLLADLRLGEGLAPTQRSAVLVRLLDLFVTILEERGWTAGRYAETYPLLLRARFLLLASLSQGQDDAVRAYLPGLDLQVRGAWQVWGGILLQMPQEMRLLLSRYGCSAEEEGARLLFSAQNDRTLRPFCAKSEADQLFTERLFTGWFLPRYDLRRVALALSQFPGRWQVLRRAMPALQMVGPWVVIAFLALPLTFGSLPFLRSWWNSLGWWANLAWCVAVVLTLSTLAQVALLGTRPLRYALPRVTLAIVAGYLFLVSSDVILRFTVRAYELRPRLAWATVVSSTLITVLAVYIEVRRRLEVQPAVLWWRVGYVWATAVTRSLTIGWLALAPAGSLLLSGSELTGQVLRSWQGWIGGFDIYPQLIFVLSPLAVFVGIFVQTIWEEYPLTHPI